MGLGFHFRRGTLISDWLSLPTAAHGAYVTRRVMSHKTLRAEIQKCALVLPSTYGSHVPGNGGIHVKMSFRGCEQNTRYTVRTHSFVHPTDFSTDGNYTLEGCSLTTRQTCKQQFGLFHYHPKTEWQCETFKLKCGSSTILSSEVKRP